MNKFNREKSSENREALCNSKRAYKLAVRKKRRAFKFKEAKEFEKLKRCKPRAFWKHFSSRNKSNPASIKLDDFQNYFRDMFNEVQGTNIAEADDFNETHNFEENNFIFEELDKPFSEAEVNAAIKRMKSNKSCAPNDLLLNEFFIESADILVGHITDIFNIIYDSGYFPQSWSEGFIVPLLKKGNKEDVSNYRGITIMSNLGKLFTNVLNARLVDFCEENDIISDSQFGFRKGRSTIDAIFILKGIVDSVLNSKGRLYCAFIDLKRAFDSINRNALWLKLYYLGIKGKLLRIIRAMYDNVKSCIKYCNNYSDFLNISVGLRQGETMSPTMFALFIEDLELYLQDRVDCGLSLQDLTLILLLFADDMVILGHSPEDLQNSLYSLSNYCEKWGLEVNVAKTKVVVFRRRGRVFGDEKWYFKGSSIDVVNDFNYLGVIFNYTGSFTLNNQFIYGKGLKAMNILLTNIRKFEINPKLSLQLFDAFVQSVLIYGSPVWGFTKSKDLERIHLKFCKRILGVKLSTSNVGVYGELGRFPLYINRYTSIIKYWLKLNCTDNIILKTIYQRMLCELENGANNWAGNVKYILSKYVFLYVWENPTNIGNINCFINSFKNRVQDEFLQEWFASIGNSSKLLLYKEIKSHFGYESYLDNIVTKKYRSILTKIRLTAHNLKIETGRYARNPIERRERLCVFCDENLVEDEYHFVIECNAYAAIRAKYIKKYYTAKKSMFKFIELFQSPKNTILNLCKYLIEAFALRNSLQLS